MEKRELINLTLVAAHTAKEHGFDHTAAALLAIVSDIVSPSPMHASKRQSSQAIPTQQPVYGTAA